MDEGAFRDRLAKLNTSQQSIEYAGAYCLVFQNDARRVAEVRCSISRGAVAAGALWPGWATTRMAVPAFDNACVAPLQAPAAPPCVLVQLLPALLSLWLLSLVCALPQIWEDVFSKSDQPKRLAMVYLANQIVQTR